MPASKTEFLVALHTLLIGDHAHGAHRALDRAGAHAARARHHAPSTPAAPRTGERPRERLLYEELRRLAREQAADAADGDATVASEYRRLAERLHPYIDDGPSAWLADHATTIPTGAPLLLFDLAGLPDALAGPVMLTLVDFIDRDVQRRRAQHLAHPGEQAGPWAGRAFVAIDEAWKPLLTPAAGAWLNEWARRTRHLACALLVITQHLADFANAQGEALLRNCVLRLFFRTSSRRARLRPRRARPAPGGPRRDRARWRRARASTPPASSTPKRTAAARSGCCSATWSTGPARPTRTATSRSASSRSPRPTATPGKRCGCSSTPPGTTSAPQQLAAPRSTRPPMAAAMRRDRAAPPPAASLAPRRRAAGGPRPPRSGGRALVAVAGRRAGARCSSASSCWCSCCSPAARSSSAAPTDCRARSPAPARSAASPAPASPARRSAPCARQPVRRRPRSPTGAYVTTAYGPPWGGIQGAGHATSGGLAHRRRRAALVHGRRRPAR